MKASELLNAQTSAKKQDNRNSGKYTEETKELIKRFEVENSPFTIIWEENIGWYAVIGNYRMTEARQTKEAIEKEIKVPTWEMIIRVVGIITESIIKINK